MSHSLTSNVKRQINENEEVDRTEVDKTEVDNVDSCINRKSENRKSIDYERTGLAD